MEKVRVRTMMDWMIENNLDKITETIQPIIESFPEGVAGFEAIAIDEIFEACDFTYIKIGRFWFLFDGTNFSEPCISKEHVLYTFMSKVF